MIYKLIIGIVILIIALIILFFICAFRLSSIQSRIEEELLREEDENEY